MIHHVRDLHVTNSYAGLPDAFYSRVQPQPLNDPRLLHANQVLAHEMGWDATVLSDPDFLAVCSGAQALPNGDTLAAAYSGHQFGIWAGQLGDGRAHLLGEVASSSGPLELQLKGSGHTPYSRMGDGRAVVRSSVREYLASEAMWGLGIPTTRALAIVVSDDPVYRETVETAAIVTRVSPSFIRFGTFEHVSRSTEHLEALLAYVVDRFYPDCRTTSAGQQPSSHDTVLCFLDQVVQRTATLMADWLVVGFCHGVMNTDNMSVLGLTLDYGPYGFMDAFQADHICNRTDTQGRYAWNAQPSAANWNLHRLASSLMGLGVEADALKRVLERYESLFLQAYRTNMAAKFGLQSWRSEDDDLADSWWKLLHQNKADFTNSFRYLSDVPGDSGMFLSQFQDQDAAQRWLEGYLMRVSQDGRDDRERKQAMDSVNPVYVLRNHLAQQAIDGALQGDASVMDTLLMLLRDPCTPRQGYEDYTKPPVDGLDSPALSCSS